MKRLGDKFEIMNTIKNATQAAFKDLNVFKRRKHLSPNASYQKHSNHFLNENKSIKNKGINI